MRFDTAKRMSPVEFAFRLPPCMLAREPAAAHRLRPAQLRRRDARGVLVVHAANGIGRGRRPTRPRREQAEERLCGTGREAAQYTRPVRIAIGGDHAGYPLKQHLIGVLKKWGHDVDDLGTTAPRIRSTTRSTARRSRRAVVRGDADVGIVLGGSGQGEQISANKVRGVRAALCNDLYTARMARAAQRRERAVDRRPYRRARARRRDHPASSSTTPFEGGRHERRLDEITAIETEESQDCDDDHPWSAPTPRSPTSSARARAAEHDDPAHRVGELHVARGARGAGLGAHQQVLRGLSRPSATTAATSSSTTPRTSRAIARARCSAPSTRTCSRTRVRTRTRPRSWRCSSPATR